MSSFASLRYLASVALAVRHATRQAVCCSGRGFQGFTQRANSVNDVALSPGMFFRDTSVSFLVDRHVLL